MLKKFRLQIFYVDKKQQKQYVFDRILKYDTIESARYAVDAKLPKWVWFPVQTHVEEVNDSVITNIDKHQELVDKLIPA